MTDEPRPVVVLPIAPQKARAVERALEESIARHPAGQQALPCPATLELPPIGSGAAIQCQKQLGHDGNHAANEPPASENLPPIRRVWPRNGLPTPPRKDAP